MSRRHFTRLDCRTWFTGLFIVRSSVGKSLKPQSSSPNRRVERTRASGRTRNFARPKAVHPRNRFGRLNGWSKIWFVYTYRWFRGRHRRRWRRHRRLWRRIRHAQRSTDVDALRRLRRRNIGRRRHSVGKRRLTHRRRRRWCMRLHRRRLHGRRHRWRLHRRWLHRRRNHGRWPKHSIRIGRLTRWRGRRRWRKRQ